MREGGEVRHAAGEEEDLAGADVVVAQRRLNVLLQDDPEEVWKYTLVWALRVNGAAAGVA